MLSTLQEPEYFLAVYNRYEDQVKADPCNDGITVLATELNALLQELRTFESGDRLYQACWSKIVICTNFLLALQNDAWGFYSD